MKKILLVLAGLVLLILAAMAIVPFIFKDKILHAVKDAANKEVNATIDFNNDINLSFFSHFPDFTLGVKDLSVVGVDAFKGDTLLSLKEFTATLDLMSIIGGGQIRIEGIDLYQPRIKALVTKDGHANWDIAKPSADTAAKPETDTAATAFNVTLKSLTVRDAWIYYDDKAANMKAELIDFNHSLEGDFTQDQFLMKTLTACKSLSFAFGGIPYLNKLNLNFKADVDADMKNMKFTFKDNEVKLNNLAFAFAGWYEMKEKDMNMDLTYAAQKASFHDFLSLVPAIYAKDFDQLKTSGSLAFNGFVKGTYNESRMPAFALNLLVENGMFQYPALPVPVKNFGLNLAVTNPDGDLNNTKVDLSKLHFEVSGDPFDARLIATNLMKDPTVDAFFKGRINLDNVSKIVPLEAGTTVTGLIAVDLTAKGRVSTLENQQYEDFNAAGNLSVTNLRYASKELPSAFNLKETSLSFSPKIVKLNTFDATIGASDFKMNGDLSGFFGYALGKGTLHGTLNLISNNINANEFLSADTTATAKPDAVDTTSMVAPEIPGNIDFTLNSRIAKLLYTNMEITDFNGQVKIADQKLAFNRVSLKTLGSTMGMDGYYETTNPKTPTVVMDFSIANLDIQKAFVTFNTVKRLAPIAENTEGSFSTRFKLNTALDQHLNPVYDQLFAEGNLDIPQARVKDVPFFNKAADVLHYDKLKDPGFSNLKIKYKVEKGRIYTQPFDLTIASQKMTLSGSTGLDQTIDYTGKVSIPRSALGTANNALNSMLAQANAKAGTNVKLSEVIPVNLLVGGTFKDPKITTNLGDIAKNEAGSLKDQLAAEAARKKQELEAKARAEADRLKKEAETKARAEADRLKKEAEAKARAEADRLKKEAEAKAAAEKEKAKKKLEEEAKKKLKGLF